MSKTKDNSFLKFLILCSGGFIAAIGNGITSFGIGIYVFELTGLASAKAIISLLAFLPALLLSPLAGVLADRYDRRLLMILGDGLSALGIAYILFCMQTGEPKLWQIGIGVTISSIFSSLIEPSFKATVTDLLSKDDYSKASGFIQLSGSAKFLISPPIAGFLLIISDIKLLLIIDILTIVITVLCTLFVRQGIVSKVSEKKESIKEDFKVGFKALTNNRGVFVLTLMGVFISFFLGFIQELSTPMVLAFADSAVLGTSLSICASGMLVSSLLLGFIPIKKNFAKVLSVSLFLAGLFMAGFGLRENITIIRIFGFLFFAMLPFCNTSIDYLIHTNIPNQVQGRVWGFIGVISQFGYIFAYAVVGFLADYIFTPLLLENGTLANSVGTIIGVGKGRGIGLLIIIAGALLALTAVVLHQLKSIKKLESRDEVSYVQQAN